MHKLGVGADGREARIKNLGWAQGWERELALVAVQQVILRAAHQHAWPPKDTS